MQFPTRTFLGRATSTLAPLLAVLACASVSRFVQTRCPMFTASELLAAPQPAHAVLSPDGKWLAYIVDDSVWVAPTDGTIEPRAVVGGVRGEASNPVSMLVWSPDAQMLLYRAGGGNGAAGEGGGEMRISDLRVPGASTFLFPDSLRTRLGTFQTNLAGGPAWAPNGRYVAILAARLGDSQYGLQAYVVDLRDHSVRRWTEEGRRRFSVAWSPDSHWLAVTSGDFTGRGASIDLFDGDHNVLNPRLAYRAPTALLRALRWAPDGRFLLAQDEDDAPYLVAIDSNGITGPALHKLPAAPYVAWFPGDTALLATTPDRMSRRAVAISIATGRPRYITGADTNVTLIGIASDELVGAGPRSTPRLIYRMESGSIPPDIWSVPIEPSTSSPRNLSRIGVAIDTNTLPRTVIYQWTRGDSSRGLAQLLLPRRISSNGKRLPLIVVPYGAFANTFPKSDYFLDAGTLSLIASGYAVVKPNTRGTASEPSDSGRYGAIHQQDTELLLDALVRDGIIDPKRVAVIGHSHGGTLAYYYLTHSTRFCSIVAVNGRADWILQANYANDGLLPGALGGTPSALPGRYQEFSPVANTRKATSPLLAVAGELDNQILPANVRILEDSMRAAGKTIEVLRFADEGHLLLRPEHQVLFWERVYRLLGRNCS